MSVAWHLDIFSDSIELYTVPPSVVENFNTRPPLKFVLSRDGEIRRFPNWEISFYGSFGEKALALVEKIKTDQENFLQDPNTWLETCGLELSGGVRVRKEQLELRPLGVWSGKVEVKEEFYQEIDI